MEVVKKWYAVYTRPRWEKKLAALLTRKKIENYCPLNKVQRQWSDRRKIIYEPLFTCYVFVRVTEKERVQVLQTDGVLRYVNWQGKPAVIRDTEIDLIKDFLQEHPAVKLEKSVIDINDKVCIKYGVFIEQEGKVVEVLNKTLRISLPSLGYMMLIEIPKTHVEVVKQKYLQYSGD